LSFKPDFGLELFGESGGGRKEVDENKVRGISNITLADGVFNEVSGFFQV
jgi:hypothetical protein